MLQFLITVEDVPFCVVISCHVSYSVLSFHDWVFPLYIHGVILHSNGVLVLVDCNAIKFKAVY